MDNQKRKIILIGSVVGVVLIIILVVVIISKKDSPVVLTAPETVKLTDIDKIDKSAEIAKEEFETTYQNITGTVSSVNTSTMEVILENGGKITLNIPEKSASFLKTTKQENGEILTESIGLFDIPNDQLVDVQYNIRTNEVILVVIK